MRRIVAIVLALLGVCAGALGAAPLATVAANQNVGYVDFSFGSTAGTDPTADKPQSKLWHNDGRWWGILFNSASNTWRIYKLNWPDQWVDTGTVVDNRTTSRADALWDGSKLYIVSLVRLTSSNKAQLTRYTYSPTSQTYSLDSGFPVEVMSGSAETLALDKDTTGRLWINYTQSSKVYVAHSNGSDTSWVAPFVISGPTPIGADDISSIVAYNDQDGPSVGVLWSNHTSTSGEASMNFSYHVDSDPPDVWQPIETIYGGKGTCLADDHINLKSLQADPSGTIFAAVKTSVSDSGSCTGGTDLIRLVVRYPDNTWKWAAFGGKNDQHTRPIVLLDSTNRKVYMFATAPTSCGVIYMKSTSMDNPSFPTGKGTPFVSSSTYTCINNVTSTKQTVSSATGLVVLASDESKKFYLHNVLELGAPPPDVTAPTVLSRTPADAATELPGSTSVTATFSEVVTGVNGTSFTLKPAGGSPLAATVTYDAASRTATLQPSALLAANTTYTAQLASTIADVAGNPLAATSWSFTTAPPDLTAPTVTAKSPAAGATGVPMTSAISATFSEPVGGVSSNTFRLNGPSGAVAASVTYDAASRTATLQPSANLAPSSTYTAQLLTGIADSAGNPLAPLSWSFTTASAPAVTLLNGGFEIDANGDSRPDSWTGNAKFTRSSAIAPHGGSFAGQFSASDNSGVTISQALSNIVPGVSYDFAAWTNIPATADSFGLVYEVRWLSITNSTIGTSSIKTYTAATNGWEQAQATLIAPAGAANAQVRMVVTSLNATLYVDDLAFANTPPPADTTAPTVGARVPAPSATGVLSNTGISATFSEPVSGVSGANFKLNGPSGPVAASVSYSAGSNTATLQPSARLTPGATYTAQLLAGIADSAGNPLAPLSWSFTVAPPPPPPGDTTPPSVASHTPVNGALGVPINALIRASFSEAIAPATLTGASFKLVGPSGQVAASVSYNAATKTATLQALGALEPSATYVATLTGGVTDLSGNHLAAFSWSFTTGTSAAPDHKVYLPLATDSAALTGAPAAVRREP